MSNKQASKQASKQDHQLIVAIPPDMHEKATLESPSNENVTQLNASG
jgi:hypothetical protein